MKIFKVDHTKRLQAKDINEVIKILKKNGVIVVPSDTSYGLAALVSKPIGLKHLFNIKGRGHNKTVSMAVRNQKQANEYGIITKNLWILWRRFLPGPLTIIAKSKLKRLLYIRRDDGTVAIRFVDTPVIKQILKATNKPITLTSANRAGMTDVYSLDDFLVQYKSKRMPDAFIDVGKLKKNLPSTVVRIDECGNVDIVRKGLISEKTIINTLKHSKTQ